jgi:hypothetical protein
MGNSSVKGRAGATEASCATGEEGVYEDLTPRAAIHEPPFHGRATPMGQWCMPLTMGYQLADGIPSDSFSASGRPGARGREPLLRQGGSLRLNRSLTSRWT